VDIGPPPSVIAEGIWRGLRLGDLLAPDRLDTD